MEYKKLSELYEKLISTTKRLEKIEILSNFLKKLSKEDKDVIYLLLGKIYPDYREEKIGISDKLVIKSISKATGFSDKEIIQKWKTLGDLGKVGEYFSKNKTQTNFQTKELTTKHVLDVLRKLPTLEGKGTVSQKLSLITELFTSASPLEAHYLVRTLLGDLRIGIQESTIREAISKAFFKGLASKEVQNAIDKTNDLALVFKIAKDKDLEELKKLKLIVGVPIKAMLAQKVLNIKEGFKVVGKPCAIEYKYDGFRLMIHKKDNKIFLFTRRLENVTKQFPEIVEYSLKYVKASSFILDSEVVGYDRKTKKYTSFQAISQRIKRKYDIKKLMEKLPVEINVFDILYYNGSSVLNEPFEKRTALIKKIIENKPYKIICAKQIITSNEKEAEEFYKKALRDGQEGVMMKNLKSSYKPGRRVGNMIKIKPEERDLDLTITRAEYGVGKRSGWLSSFTLACKGDDGKFLEIGKVGTGIRELENSGGVTFKQLTKLLKPLIIKEKGKEVFVKPKIIISVTYQEIQKSPTYNSGLALRFPRVVALRPDKPLSEITSLKEIKSYLNKKRNWRFG